MKHDDIFKIDNWRDDRAKIIGKKAVLFNHKLFFLNPFIKPEKLEETSIRAASDYHIFKKDEDYVSITAISKNEAPYIKEWIEYHRLIGVDRFYFYDNESQDNTKEILQPYIEAGIVIYHYVKGKSMQLSVYNDSVARYKNHTRWMAFIDLDEYILPVQKDDIKEFLKDYEKYSAICINQIMFDSNGHKKRPVKKAVIEAYSTIKKNYKEDVSVKTICDPKKVKYITDPHFCFIKGKIVNENFEKQNEAPVSKKHSTDKIRINNYFCKSEEDYKIKLARKKMNKLVKKSPLEVLINFPSIRQDYVIFKYVEKLKRRLIKK